MSNEKKKREKEGKKVRVSAKVEMGGVDDFPAVGFAN
jgi:hypothetical protein